MLQQASTSATWKMSRPHSGIESPCSKFRMQHPHQFFTTVLVFGWMLLFSGVFGLVHAFRTHRSRGFLLPLLSALFRGFTGYLLIRYPLAGAASLTLVLASFFIVSGLFRAIGAGMLKLPRWGWSVFSGLVFVGAGNHVASANAGFERLVHRLRHWRGSDLRWRLSDRTCYSHSQPS
jgi:Short repeat of unknown function (DUF308)